MKDKKNALSLRKIIGISLALVIILGISVIAGNVQLNNVTIRFANNHEITVMTSKTKVSEILSDNHISIASNETVIPGMDEDITNAKLIIITTIGNEPVKIAEISEEELNSDLDKIASDYSNITEQIITIREEIPYETITKDVSNGGTTANKVIQEGKNGIREVTYKIKYKNDIEIEKIELSSKVIQEPVNKIVQIQTKVTSRGGSRFGTGAVLEYQQYAATMCYSYGWSETDVECLIRLWNKESGWNPYACNKSSGAYGIPQALPASKMASKGLDYKTNYQTQIKWGLSYIKSRYGNPQNAWNHSQAKGWY